VQPEASLSTERQPLTTSPGNYTAVATMTIQHQWNQLQFFLGRASGDAGVRTLQARATLGITPEW
jgi:hypothetical protein